MSHVIVSNTSICLSYLKDVVRVNDTLLRYKLELSHTFL